MNCLWSLNDWGVELTVYQGQLHLVTFWGVIQCNLCMPHIHGSTQCAVEKAPTGSQLLTCYFFFFFFKKYKLSAEFGSEMYAETWEFGLRKFNKSQNGQFWGRSLVLPICATGCYTDGWGRRGKSAVGGYRVQSLKNPTLGRLYWNREVMNEVKGWFVQGRTYNGFSPYARMRWHRGVVVVSCHVFSCWTSCIWLVVCRWPCTCGLVYHPSTSYQSILTITAFL